MALTSKDIGLDEEQKPGHPLIKNAGIVGIAVALAWQRAGGMPLGWMDYAAFVVFGLWLWWCLAPSRDRTAHDDTSNGFALRLGKLCKRALGRSKRRRIAP